MISIITIFIFFSGGLNESSVENIVPTLGVFALAGHRIKQSFQYIFSSFVSLKYAEITVNKITNEIKNYKFKKIIKKSIKPLIPKKNISLKNISFKYPGTEKKIFEKLNLDILIGSSVGIIGSTGAGKTTLVDLILFLKPNEGKILLDDIEINNDNVLNWQKSIGYVPQDIYLSDKSIAENIAIA